VSSRRGEVFDLGYAPYDGPRRGRRGAVTATLLDGMLRIMGMRRRARAKILPWLLLGLAVLPAVVFVGFAFLLTSFAPQAESPFGGHAEYFDVIGTIVLLFSALAAPELLVPDRRDGVLAVYASRPLLPRDYVLARTGALGAALAVFLLVPQLLMWVGFAGLADTGFLSGLVSGAADLPKVLLAAVAYAAGYGPPALLVAAYAPRKSFASGAYLGIMLIGLGVVGGITQATTLPGNRFAVLAALVEHPAFVRDGIFGRTNPDLLVARAGFSPWLSALVIAVVAVASLALVVRRYRRFL